MSGTDHELDGDVATEQDDEVAVPRSYDVVLHNDNFTTMEFVVMILQRVFHHPPAAAAQVMLAVHNQGRGVAGTFVRDIAETKRSECISLARRAEFPLKVTVEPATS